MGRTDKVKERKNLLQTNFPCKFTSAIHRSLAAGCTGSGSSLGTSKRHKVRVFYQQMFEAPDEELATQGGMVGENPVQYPAGVDQQEPVPGYGIVLVLNALVKDLQ